MTEAARRIAGRAALAGVSLLVMSCAAGRSVVAPAEPPRAAPAATPTAPPTPVETGAQAEPAPAATIPERPDTRPPLVRVLVQAVGSSLLPEPGRRYVCVAGGGPVVLRGPLSARTVEGRAGIQVGAFAQDQNAQAACARLRAAGFDAEVAGGGAELRRVIAYGGRDEEPEGLARRLRLAGFPEQRPASAEAGAVVVEGEGGATLQGARVRVVPLDTDPVRVGSKALRGEFEFRPAGRTPAVINVVSLEEYLRGVVPAEMGPRAFPLLEALKAQAVAARTYAVTHLGDHAAEGYDLCDSQLCQVYEGAGAEQALSDRAVSETAGEIVTWGGKPIDAMYHSTCAGHTEDADAVFPQRAAPYLKGVRCRGERTLALGAARSAGPWMGETERLAAVAARFAAALGVPANAAALTARLAGARPGPGLAGIARAFGLGETAKALRVGGASLSDESTLELLRTFRLPLSPPPSRGSRAGWESAAVVRVGQLAGALQALSGRLVPGPRGVRLVLDGSEAARDLTGRESVLERRGARWRLNALDFSAGSAATLWCAGDVCPAVEVEPLDDADAGSSWTWWVREMALDEVGRRLGVPGVRAVAVTRRGVSGRAVAVAVTGSGGTTEVAGMAFRRALELPDTLFTVAAVRPASGPALRFLGRGWGHGVGMCQNGAYGLARGGASYAEILKTYYTGVELSHWEGGDHEHKVEAGRRDP